MSLKQHLGVSKEARPDVSLLYQLGSPNMERAQLFGMTTPENMIHLKVGPFTPILAPFYGCPYMHMKSLYNLLSWAQSCAPA